MIPFKTTQEQLLELTAIVKEMEKERLPKDFITKAYELARTDQGVFDLMFLWTNAKNEILRDEILIDIQNSIDDYGIESCPMCDDTGYELTDTGGFCTMCSKGLSVAMRGLKNGPI